MAYNVPTEFREKAYSGESIYKCKLIINNTEIPNEQISNIKISSPIIDTTSKNFYIGTFISQQIVVKFRNLDGIDIKSGYDVYLEISQKVGDEWVDVPIGNFLIDDLAENYTTSCEITCLDYAIKFKQNIDYSFAFDEDGKTTIDNLLRNICGYYDVGLGDYPDTNGDVEIYTYDSSISGKQYISYIAELKGCNAKIDRDGNLQLIPIKRPSEVQINALKSKSWSLGEKFEVTRVCYEDAIRKFEKGTNDENTLYIRSDNPFVVGQNVIDNIFDEVNGLVVYSVKCENYGDISLDAWDIIEYSLDDETYLTYNDNEIVYEMTVMSKVETKIPTEYQQENVNVIGGSEETKYKILKTLIDQNAGNIIMLAGETTTNTETLEELTKSVQAQLDETKYQINALQKQTSSDGVETLKNSLVTIDINGINVSSGTSEISTTMNNERFEIKSNSSIDPLAYFGYDEKTKSTKAEMSNLTVTNYFVTGHHRIEKFEPDGERRTGIFFIG